MSISYVIAAAIGGILLGLAAGLRLPGRSKLTFSPERVPTRRILLPFTGQAISRRALEAAVRLAKAENAIIMPALLARVPMNLSLDTPLPVQCALGMPLLETIEQRASAEGVQVDTRIGRGRSYRDALRHLLAEEHFDRIIISADENPHAGLDSDDLRWLLQRVRAEILILRPAQEDTRVISADPLALL